MSYYGDAKDDAAKREDDGKGPGKFSGELLRSLTETNVTVEEGMHLPLCMRNPFVYGGNFEGGRKCKLAIKPCLEPRVVNGSGRSQQTKPNGDLGDDGTAHKIV